MKALVVGLAACFVLGTGTYFFVAADAADGEMSGDASRVRGSKQKSSLAQRGSPADGQDLEARVEALEDEVRQLRSELKLRRTFAGAGAPEAAGWDEAMQDPQARGALHEAVEDAVQDVQQQEREARRERRAERMAEMRAESLAEFAQKVGLAAEAQREIGELWQSEQDQIMPLFDKAREGEISFREVRDQIEGVREQTDAAAYALLDEDQRAAYDEHRPGPGGRGGRGGPGGPGGR